MWSVFLQQGCDTKDPLPDALKIDTKLRHCSERREHRKIDYIAV